jgi:hypothetical protein
MDAREEWSCAPKVLYIPSCGKKEIEPPSFCDSRSADSRGREFESERPRMRDLLRSGNPGDDIAAAAPGDDLLPLEESLGGKGRVTAVGVLGLLAVGLEV